MNNRRQVIESTYRHYCSCDLPTLRLKIFEYILTILAQIPDDARKTRIIETLKSHPGDFYISLKELIIATPPVDRDIIGSELLKGFFLERFILEQMAKYFAVANENAIEFPGYKTMDDIEIILDTDAKTFTEDWKKTICNRIRTAKANWFNKTACSWEGYRILSRICRVVAKKCKNRPELIAIATNWQHAFDQLAAEFFWRLKITGKINQPFWQQYFTG